VGRIYFESADRNPAVALHFIEVPPEVIVGTGGYTSAPVLMAASLLRKIGLSKTRVFIHEQNAAPGKLNRLMGRFAHKVFVTFPETLSCFPQNGILAGYPLRKRITRVDPEEALRKIDLQIPEGRKIVLVFGGSQGSRTMNRALVDALQYLIPHRTAFSSFTASASIKPVCTTL